MFFHEGIISVVKRVMFVVDRISCVCDILNVRALVEVVVTQRIAFRLRGNFGVRFHCMCVGQEDFKTDSW